MVQIYRQASLENTQREAYTNIGCEETIAAGCVGGIDRRVVEFEYGFETQHVGG